MNLEIKDGVLEGYYGYVDNLVIPCFVTRIGKSALRGCTRLTTIVIPDSITSIGDFAFSGCINLKSVIIPKSVKIIGDYAFANCKNLNSVVISDSVTSIGNWAFSGCISLTSLVLPEFVTSIGIGVLEECTSLTSVVLPDSIMGLEPKMLMKIFGKTVPGYINVSFKCYGSLKDEIRNSALRGFLKRWGDGELNEEEIAQLAEIVKGKLIKSVGWLGEALDLYRFATEFELITKPTLKKLLEKTESLECRAILLEYANKFSTKGNLKN